MRSWCTGLHSQAIGCLLHYGAWHRSFFVSTKRCQARTAYGARHAGGADEVVRPDEPQSRRTEGALC